MADRKPDPETVDVLLCVVQLQREEQKARREVHPVAWYASDDESPLSAEQRERLASFTADDYIAGFQILLAELELESEIADRARAELEASRREALSRLDPETLVKASEALFAVSRADLYLQLLHYAKPGGDWEGRDEHWFTFDERSPFNPIDKVKLHGVTDEDRAEARLRFDQGEGA